MRSVETKQSFPLSAVKPLEDLRDYRRSCLDAAASLLATSGRRRQRSPVTGVPLEVVGDVDGLEYATCPDTGGLFLASVAPPAEWGRLLADVAVLRRGFHGRIAGARATTVHGPRAEWIRSVLLLQGIARSRVLEVVTPPSEFTPFLGNGPLVEAVTTEDESALPASAPGDRAFEAAVLLESLDRVGDPVALLRAVADRLASGGLVFVSGLVASGFDIAVLGLRNQYLYPPDRTNCFSIEGLRRLLDGAGFDLIEVSTPGVLDLEIVREHARADPSLAISAFERRLLDAGAETQEAFRAFLQQNELSSSARLVGVKRR